MPIELRFNKEQIEPFDRWFEEKVGAGEARKLDTFGDPTRGVVLFEALEIDGEIVHRLSTAHVQWPEARQYRLIFGDRSTIPAGLSLGRPSGDVQAGTKAMGISAEQVIALQLWVLSQESYGFSTQISADGSETYIKGSIAGDKAFKIVAKGVSLEERIRLRQAGGRRTQPDTYTLYFNDEQEALLRDTGIIDFDGEIERTE